jgi:transcriptional regulator with XRE-family HTH domain
MSDSREEKFALDQYIGVKVKKWRLRQGLKITDVSRISGISQGMISKIENAQVATSLETLSKLCASIGLPMSKLFNDYDQAGGTAQFTQSGQGLEIVRRGTEKGHTYQLLTYQRGGNINFEPFLITMDDVSEIFPSFSHPGEEFIYLLKGEIQYRHGNHLYTMKPGDSLTFDGEVPHGPEKLIDVPIQLLSIINYADNL